MEKQDCSLPLCVRAKDGNHHRIHWRGLECGCHAQRRISGQAVLLTPGRGRCGQPAALIGGGEGTHTDSRMKLAPSPFHCSLVLLLLLF